MFLGDFKNHDIVQKPTTSLKACMLENIFETRSNTEFPPFVHLGSKIGVITCNERLLTINEWHSLKFRPKILKK